MADNWAARDGTGAALTFAAKEVGGAKIPQSIPTAPDGTPYAAATPMPVRQVATVATGARVTTTANPQQILASNAARRWWRVMNISRAAGDTVGLSYDGTNIIIPLSYDGTALPGYEAAGTVESNAIYFHGPVGTVLGVMEG